MRYAAFAIVLATGCAVTVPDDWFSCVEDADCPNGFSCVAGHCRSGGDGGAEECASDDACDDHIACTVDRCTSNRCAHAPDDTLCLPGTTCSAIDGCQAATCSAETCRPERPCEEARCEDNRCVRSSRCGEGQSCCDGVCFDGECEAIDLCAGKPEGEVCRAATELCDVPERCDGVSPACPTDEFQPEGVLCQSAGECDVEERCTGESAECPLDEFAPAGEPCDGGTCNGLGICLEGCIEGAACSVGNECEQRVWRCTDGPERCELVGPAEAGTRCRASAGDCDPQETCDGVSTECPADVRTGAGIPCRGSSGGCDPAESCDGSSAACPSDVWSGGGTPCRVGSLPCDVDEYCAGSSPSCPGDAYRSAAEGVVCRFQTDVCDLYELCDGTSPYCPPDRYAPAGTVCGEGDGTCLDDVDYCTGGSPYCYDTMGECVAGTTEYDGRCSGTCFGGRPRCLVRSCDSSCTWTEWICTCCDEA
jgi:hypothetical protein